MNGTWQSVNQTLCGSAETAELQEIYKAATASVSGSENTVAENFKMQVTMIVSFLGKNADFQNMNRTQACPPWLNGSAAAFH